MNTCKTSFAEVAIDKPRELMIVIEQMSCAINSLECNVDNLFKRLDPITTCGPVPSVIAPQNEHNFDVRFANEMSCFIARIESTSRAIANLERGVQI